MSDPLPAPSFGSLGFNVAPMNIGEGYAQGITEAGKAAASTIGAVSDIAKQNMDANDTLTAMKEGNILPQDAYESVMGKSLGAKQQMLGLYAGQYIANQAARRAQDLQMGKSSADIHTEHAKLIDTMRAVQSGYGAAVGVQPGKMPVQPNQPPPRAQPANVQVQPKSALGPVTVIAPNPAMQPLGSGNIYNPPAMQPPAQTKPLTIGPPMGAKDVIPQGAQPVTVRGQKGFLLPDGTTFRPIQ
jgi:hypothetical protein